MFAELGFKQRAIVAAGQCGFDETDTVLGCDIVSARLGGDDADLIGSDLEMAQQQRQNALSDAAEADDNETACEGDVLLVEHGGQRSMICRVP